MNVQVDHPGRVLGLNNDRGGWQVKWTASAIDSEAYNDFAPPFGEIGGAITSQL